MNIEQTIEDLYRVFSKYTPSNMHYCDCGCIDKDDVKNLASKKLRELEEDDFSSYHGSALYTWGEIEHYKHFLPRILEVHNQKNGKGLIGLFEIILKLEYAEWEKWDENEVKAIRNFIFADWNTFIGGTHSEIGADDIECYSFFFHPIDLINTWDLTKDENRLKNFVNFFYYNGTEIINKGLKIKDKTYNEEFLLLINQSELLTKLEDEFFKVDEIDKDYGERISIVIQMIEQQKTEVKNK